MQDLLRARGDAAGPETGQQANHVQPAASQVALAPAQDEDKFADLPIPQPEAVPQAPVSTNVALNRHVAVQPGSHAARSASSGEAGAGGLHTAGLQSAPGADSGPLAHIPVAGQGPDHALHPTPPASSGAAIASHETFAALDGEPSAAGPAWIHAGTQRAEAGFQDPALGWVGVRAQVGGGGVHAAIIPGTPEAAQALGGHLAGLHAHLAAEQIPVLSLGMRASAEDAGAGLGQGGLQQDSGHSGQGRERGAGFQGSIHDSAAGGHIARHSAVDLEVAPARMAGQGTYISVMA